MVDYRGRICCTAYGIVTPIPMPANDVRWRGPGTPIPRLLPFQQSSRINPGLGVRSHQVFKRLTSIRWVIRLAALHGGLFLAEGRGYGRQRKKFAIGLAILVNGTPATVEWRR